MLSNLDGGYRVIVGGDGLMDLGALTGGSDYNRGGTVTVTGLDWLRRFKERYRHLVWLTPEDCSSMLGSFWGQSYGIIKKEVETRTLTVATLTDVVKKLMVAR